MENSISKLQESLTSLSEAVLQNRKGLDLLFLQQDLCAALKEECCFYIDHSGVVKDLMAKVREGAGEKRERERNQGWFNLGLTLSPWLTTLTSILLGPLLSLMLLFTFGPCILNCLLAFTREHIGTVQIVMLRQQYQELSQSEQ